MSYSVRLHRQLSSKLFKIPNGFISNVRFFSVVIYTINICFGNDRLRATTALLKLEGKQHELFVCERDDLLWHMYIFV